MAADWKRIETEYITTTIGYRELAKKYSVPLNTVAHYGKTHKLPEKRKQYGHKVVTGTVAKIAGKESEKLVNLIRAADNMSRKIEDILSDSEQFKTYVSHTREIKDLTSAMKDLTYVIRNLNDLPTLAEIQAREIAIERLKLEKQKADTEQSSAQEITVTFRGNCDGYAD